MNATPAPVERSAGDEIHTGTLRMRRRLWTVLELAVEKYAGLERADLADYLRMCRSIDKPPTPATLASFETRIADLGELAPLVHAAAIQIAEQCMAVARQATEDGWCHEHGYRQHKRGSPECGRATR